ncbi:MAG TPA: nucleoside triphosphate pyrophosphatase [Thermodesulfobacteriota bacterium]|nr:nucleoside triphosphate pyrophosphatase [Thermodesulfobacteriota bacterium]
MRGRERAIILASASPRRREILRSAAIPFAAVPAEVDETPRPGENPKKYAARVARDKARKISPANPGRWVLAADTIVVYDGKILGKPRDRRAAREMLLALSGREHEVITGYCLVKGSTTREALVITRVVFKPLSAREIEWYLDTGEPFDKAGAYAIQGKASFMVKGIRGSYTNVVGLPLTEVVEDLRSLRAVPLFLPQRAQRSQSKIKKQ